MFQTSESCIKLHAVAVLELFLSEQCPLLQVCVCVCVHCSRCVCAWMGQMQRTHFTAGYTLYNCVTNVKKKTISDYGKMLKYREKYICKPIYRSISNFQV